MTPEPCGKCSYCRGERGTDGCKWADEQRSIKRKKPLTNESSCYEFWAEIGRLEAECRDKDERIRELEKLRRDDLYEC